MEPTTGQRKPLGKLLKEKGIINESHIQFALQEQKITHERIGEVLERLCFVTDYDVITCLSEQEGIPYIDVDTVIAEERILKLFRKNFCLNNIMLPFRVHDNAIEVAIASVVDQKLTQAINRHSGLKPRYFFSEKKKIINAINRFYYFFEHPIEKLIEKEIRLLSQDREMARGTENLVKYILHLAVKQRATDIHIRPMDKSINVSFRVDGVISSAFSMPVALSRIITSLKMKADMDIAEQRIPQDGSFSETILNNGYEFRASTLVLPEGENMVLRVLPTESAAMGMAQIGFLDEDIETVGRLFNEPFGIVLLTGPTGSGKTTTLYAGIRSMDLLSKNVLTVEDPIEYHIPLLRQTQVNEKAGYTFANAIRYFLRHDPDVILVGEIRDSETAATAVAASTTGHLVLSTLHSNSAIGVIPRLRDLGVRPFLISDSLLGVVSQRLVRKICQNCKEAYIPMDWERDYLNDREIGHLYRGRGCELCGGSGYFGRTLVYEILVVDKEMVSLIAQEADLSVVTKRARDRGFRDIFQVAVSKVREGVTTTGEVMRVLGHIRQE